MHDRLSLASRAILDILRCGIWNSNYNALRASEQGTVLPQKQRFGSSFHGGGVMQRRAPVLQRCDRVARVAG
jgi:hypothetical protein